MARPPDLAMKQELLDQVVAYLAEHGLGQASLRPLADAVGTSLARLVHHFGTKDELLAAALDRAGEIQAAIAAGWLMEDPEITVSEIYRRWWAWISESPANLAIVRLGYEAATLDATATGIAGEVRARQVGMWVEHVEERLLAVGIPPDTARMEATLIKAGFSGLVIELFATDDHPRMSRVFDEWVERVETRLEALVAIGA